MTKIILATEKTNLIGAQNYSNFILKTIISYPLFSYLTLSPVKYWKNLLFRDIYNYAGILEEGDEKKIVSQWNVVEFLPPLVEKYILSLIGDYLMKVDSFQQELADEAQNKMVDPLEEENSEERMSLLCRNYIKMNLSTRLFNALPELEKKHRKDLAVEEDALEVEDPFDYESEGDEEMDEFDAEDRQMAREERLQAKKKKKEERERLKQLWSFPNIIGRAYEYRNCIYELLNVNTTRFDHLDAYLRVLPSSSRISFRWTTISWRKSL